MNEIIILNPLDLILIAAATIALIMLVTFVVKKVIRMDNQLAPDASTKPVRTILIEGELLEVISEPELET